MTDEEWHIVEFDSEKYEYPKEIEMVDIEHVHEGLFILKDIAVPFVVSQTSDNVLACEIGAESDESKFVEIEIAVSDGGEIVVYAKKRGVPTIERFDLGNIITGRISTLRTGNDEVD